MDGSKFSREWMALLDNASSMGKSLECKEIAIM